MNDKMKATYRFGFQLIYYGSLGLVLILGFVLFSRRCMDCFQPQGGHGVFAGMFCLALSALFVLSYRIVFSGTADPHTLPSYSRTGLLLIPAILLFLGASSSTSVLMFIVLTLVVLLIHYVIWYGDRLPKPDFQFRQRFHTFGTKLKSLFKINQSPPTENTSENKNTPNNTENYITENNIEDNILSGDNLSDNIDDENECENECEEEFPEGVTQQWTRQQDSTLGETLSGWIRVEFAPEQMTREVCVAFCPPFSQTPETKQYQLSGPEVKIAVSSCFPQGMRLDLKLSECSNKPVEIVFQVEASQKGV